MIDAMPRLAPHELRVGDVLLFRGAVGTDEAIGNRILSVDCHDPATMRFVVQSRPFPGNDNGHISYSTWSSNTHAIAAPSWPDDHELHLITPADVTRAFDHVQQRLDARTTTDTAWAALQSVAVTPRSTSTPDTTDTATPSPGTDLKTNPPSAEPTGH